MQLNKCYPCCLYTCNDNEMSYKHVTPMEMTEDLLASQVLKFLEVAVHTILYQRGIYPSNLFVKSKKYGVIVHQSRHPKLNEYIGKLLRESVWNLLLNKCLSKFIFIIKNKGNIIIEQIVFNMTLFNLDKNYYRNNDISDDIVYMHKQFRNTMIKLNTMNGCLNNIKKNDDISWTIQVHTKKFNNIKHQNWIKLDRQQLNIKDDMKIIPLYSCNNDVFEMNVNVIQ